MKAAGVTEELEKKPKSKTKKKVRHPASYALPNFLTLVSLAVRMPHLYRGVRW